MTGMHGVQAIRSLLSAEFPDLKHVETSTLHRGVAGARHNFLPSPPAQNKLDVLRQVRHQSAQDHVPSYFCVIRTTVAREAHTSSGAPVRSAAAQPMEISNLALQCCLSKVSKREGRPSHCVRLYRCWGQMWPRAGE